VVGGAALIAAYVLGSVYNLLTLRAVFNGRSHARINANIKQRLLLLRTAPLTAQRREELLTNSELMDVFYVLIDSNATLRERAALVRDNGLKWSSIADAVVLGVAFSSLYLALYITTDYKLFGYWCIGSLVLALIGALLHPVAERRHVELSNSQLDFVANHLRADAERRLNAL
jgi:hypothetical protein